VKQSRRTTGKSLRGAEKGGVDHIGSIDQKMGAKIGSIAVWCGNFRAHNPRRFAETLSSTALCSLCPPATRLAGRTPKNVGGSHWTARGAPVIVLRVMGGEVGVGDGCERVAKLRDAFIGFLGDRRMSLCLDFVRKNFKSRRRINECRGNFSS